MGPSPRACPGTCRTCASLSWLLFASLCFHPTATLPPHETNRKANNTLKRSHTCVPGPQASSVSDEEEHESAALTTRDARRTRRDQAPPAPSPPWVLCRCAKPPPERPILLCRDLTPQKDEAFGPTAEKQTVAKEKPQRKPVPACSVAPNRRELFPDGGSKLLLYANRSCLNEAGYDNDDLAVAHDSR